MRCFINLSSLLYFTCILSISRSFKYCKKIDSAKFETDEGTIDLWPLALSNEQPKFKDIPDTQLTSQVYSFNPGNPWSDTRREKGDTNSCQNIAVCARWGDLSNPSQDIYANIGTQDSVDYIHDASSGSCTMKLKGKYLLSSTQSLITISCDDSTEGKLDDFVSSEQSTPWTYKSTLHTKYACPSFVSSSSLSVGSILLITFAGIIIVYLLVGILVQKFVKGASGKDVLPNVSFWSDFPFLVKDGFVFTCQTCKSKISGKNDYASI